MNELHKEFKEQAILRMQENVPRINKCFRDLTEEEIWKKPNQISNSAGNLLLHLCGNITQYIHSSLGGQQDLRLREEEFSTKGGFTKDQLLEKLSDTVDRAVAIIGMTSKEEFLRTRKVQAFEMTGMGIVIHVVEHFSYHTGQIAFWTKILHNQDLGFYDTIDLNETS